MALNQATGRDTLTTHGSEGIVPFTKGFLPLSGKYTRTFRKVVTDEKAPTL